MSGFGGCYLYLRGLQVRAKKTVLLGVDATGFDAFLFIFRFIYFTGGYKGSSLVFRLIKLKVPE